MDIKNDDLYKKHDQLIQLKRETYEKLYNRCKNRIKLTSDAGELICVFEIPQFVFGSSYPIINVVSCANYIMNKLTKANRHIKTLFIEPNSILIDWRRESDMDPRKAYMPVKESMLDVPNRRSDSERSRRRSDRSISDVSSSNRKR